MNEVNSRNLLALSQTQATMMSRLYEIEKKVDLQNAAIATVNSRLQELEIVMNRMRVLLVGRGPSNAN